MQELRISLTRPPSTNNLFAGRGARRVKTRRYAAWLAAAMREIMAARARRFFGAVSLEIALERPDARRRDCSNFVKGLEDALVTMGVIEDDSLVERVTVYWVAVRGDRAHVTVRPAESTAIAPLFKAKGKLQCTKSAVSLAA